jgi:taurine dioxygenase
MKITPLGKHLGARIEGVDLARLTDAGFRDVEAAFHQYGVIAVANQRLDESGLIAFSRRLGPLEINVASSFHHPRHPEINILSNKAGPDGAIIGSPDAGQGWHADMSYNPTPARASLLYALEVPQRDGVPLGDTLFAGMAAAYEALAPALKDQLEELEAVHDFEKFYDYMIREKGSARPPLTSAQKATKPPVTHRMIVRHPFTGERCLYADPGYTTRVVGMSDADSLGLLDYLFEFQTQPAFLYRHQWQVGDVVVWDNIATIHMATGGYGPTEHRVMWRTQVLGDAKRFRDAQDV